MFHTILTLSYIIPNIYLFIRIWRLFIRKDQRIYYVLIYLLLFLVYPVSNLFHEDSTALVARVLSAIADYLLPFFLYVFLFVLLLDLLLLINLLFGIVPREKIKRGSFRSGGLLVIVCCSLAIVVAGIINFNTIRTTKYKITIPGKLSGISHLRIAFVSDFHLQESTGIHFVEKFASKIKSIKPELMLFGGDIVEGDRKDEKMEYYERILSSITARYGVYGVLGNHEHYAGQDKGSFFSKSGIEILSDSVVIVDNSFVLAGRNDSHTRTRKSVADILGTITDSLPVILIDHRPTVIGQIGRNSPDVVLSGHTHNGQLFPINFITRMVYGLSYGYKKKGKTHFFVSSGIRLWGPPVRTTSKSEIMVIDITFTSDIP
jgi:predicted MPP superfamily phosphohydrolase